MGKKATKAADNMYYLARCEAAETNADFSSREKAAELVDIDIKTGKYIIKPLEDKDFEQLAKDGHDLNLNTWFDFDYEDCIDEKKRPIELNY